MDRSVLASKQLAELKDIASHLQMRGYQRLKKAELIDAIIAAANGGAAAQKTSEAVDGPGRPEATGRSSPRTADRTDDAQSGETRPADASGASGDGGRPPATVEDAASRADTRDEAQGDEAQGDEAQGDEAQGDEAQGDEAQGDEVRTRVRTRTRERDDAESDEGRAPNRTDDGGEQREGSQQGDRGQRSDGGQQRGGQQRGGVATRDDDDRAGQDSDETRRRRRNRRERRRGGKGGQPQHRVAARDEDQPSEPGEVRAGVLDILPEGYGFLRTSGYLPGDRDVYVSQSMIRRHGLRRGDSVEGPIRQQRSGEKVPALHSVQKVNGIEPDEQGNLPHRPEFKDMTPLFPDERLPLETPDGPISMRIIDLMSPIGKGQRGLIVSPPKAGKTTILKELGQAIAYNNPECHVMVVLVDERPEEVTDMRRSVPGEIIASTFDRPADDHTQIAELAMERAKRLVETGQDVVILLDSITRLARAYNLSAPASGRIMSGGVDSTALYPPKRFFGAARNIEGGGSLTIIASALIETGSKMDEVIFEEFKGTGNMELRLDRRLEQKRIFPAIDIEASGTRKEELLLDREELEVIWKLRRVLHALEGPAALELLIDKIKTTRSNNQFLVQIQKSNLQT
jgi:transcription termination factor Rho